jgi:hypothetical protein
MFIIYYGSSVAFLGKIPVNLYLACTFLFNMYSISCMVMEIEMWLRSLQ